MISQTDFSNEKESPQMARWQLLFRRAASLPQLPPIVGQLMAVTDSDVSSAVQIEKIISSDPALAVEILRVANSAWAGSRGSDITSISMAILRIGFRNVRDLAMSLLVHRVVAIAPAIRQRFVRHSLFSAVAARYAFARHRDQIDSTWEQNDIFSATLLHDLGIAILHHVDNAAFERVCAYGRSKEIPIQQAFQRIYRCDLCKLGALSCDVWKLPEFFSLMLGNYHEPWSCPREIGVLSCVAYGDYLAHVHGSAIEDWPCEKEVEPEVLDKASLPDSEIDLLMPLVESQVNAFLCPGSTKKAA